MTGLISTLHLAVYDVTSLVLQKDAQARQSFDTPNPQKAVCDSSAHVCREACKLDPKYITNFGEEVVRGQPVFVLSLLLQRLEPMLREAAGVAPWQVTPLLLFPPLPRTF